MCHQYPNPGQGWFSPCCPSTPTALQHIHAAPRGHLPGGQPRQGDQAHQIPQVHPAQGKRGWKYSHFCRGMSFLLAQQSHCTSAAASSCFRLVRVLYLLSYCTRISYSPRRTLWTVCSWWPRWTSGSWWAWRTLRERGGQISDGFLRAMSVRKKETWKPLTICPTSPVSPFSPGGPGRPCGGGEEEF